MTEHARELAGDEAAQREAIESFDAEAALAAAERAIRDGEL